MSTSLERLWLAAWIDGLHRLAQQPAVRPVAPLPAPARAPTPRPSWG